MTSLSDLGYLGLFIGSFLAATVVPFSSEVILLALLSMGYELVPCIAIATAGNWLGGMTGYGLGYLGKTSWIEKWFRISHEKMMRFEGRIRKYGAAIAFLSWIPFIGDPLTVALGFFKAGFWKVTLFMLIGKLFRYVLWGLLFYYGFLKWNI